MALDIIIEKLKSDFGLQPVVGVEIEFYLPGASAEAVAALEEKISLKIEKEKGEDQYEVALPPSDDPAALAWHIGELKKAIPGNFSAKPFADRPGSGLHIHLHLENDQGRNIFFRDGENYSPMLLHAIGGMLALMQEFMIVFAPSQESYARFVDKGNAPLTVSWGPNNRTVAIRLPNAPMEHKRIEHRVAGADADPVLVMAAVMAGAHYGIANKIDPGSPVHGDASLDLYGREKLITDYKEATRRFKESARLKQYR